MPDPSHDSKIIQTALEIARKGRKNAYAPYSNFLVGAAVKFVGHEQMFQGSNVENASYGASICAERSALMAAISTLGHAQIDFILVCAEAHKMVPPCALCLQTILEFANERTVIYLANTKGILADVKFTSLLPYPFSAVSMLQEHPK